MPGAAAVAGAIVTVVGASGVASTVVSTVLLVAGSALTYYAQSAGGLSDREDGLKENIGATQAALPVVYGGPMRIGIKYVDVRQDPVSIDAIYMIGALCIGSEDGSGIEDIDQVYFYGRDEVAFDTLGNVTQRFKSNGDQEAFLFQRALGTDDQPGPDAIDKWTETFPDAWPTTSRLRGIAYLALRLDWNREIFSRGLPEISADVSGNHVYDPRDDTWKFSDNNALCIRDFMLSKRYGMGQWISESDIDEQSFVDEANFCDEFVSTPEGSEKRFTCNGFLSTADSLKNNLGKLLSSCRGQVVYSGGKFKLRIRKAGSPSGFVLNEDNILGNWNFRRAGQRDTANKVTARFPDGENDRNVIEAVWPDTNQVNNFLEADGGFENTKDIDLPFTESYYMAQRIGMVLLKESREDVIVEVLASEDALDLEIHDLVQLSHETPGFDGKEFWVQSLGIRPDRKIRVGLQEYDDFAYSHDPQDTRDTLPDSELPDLLDIPEPTNLSLTEDPTTTGAGVGRPRILVEWRVPVDAFIAHVEVQYRKSSDSEWTDGAIVDYSNKDSSGNQHAYLADVEDGTTYNVRVSAVNSVSARSDWVSATISLSGFGGWTPERRWLPPEVEPGKSPEGGVPGPNIYIRRPIYLFDGSGILWNGDGRIGEGATYTSGDPIDDKEPAEAGAQVTEGQPFHILEERYFQNLVRAADDSTSAAEILGKIDNTGNLTGDSRASDGVSTGGIMRRPVVYPGLEDGDSVVFDTPYQNAPKTIFLPGGSLPGAGSGDRIAIQMEAEDLSASGFTPRLKGTERTSTTASNSDNFSSGTLTSEGQSLAITPSDDAIDGHYTAVYSYSISVTSEGTAGTVTNGFPSGIIDAVGEQKTRTVESDPTGDVTVKWSRSVSATGGPDPQQLTDQSSASLTLEVQTDTGGGFSTHSSHTYSVAVDGGDSDSDSGTDSVTVSGLSSGDQVRIIVTARSVVVGEGGSATASADPNELEYSTGTGGTASNTILVALDKRQNGGAWQEVATKSHSVEDSSGSGNTINSSSSQSFTDTTIKGSESDEIRLRLKDISTSGDVASSNESVDPTRIDYNTGSGSATEVSLTDEGDKITAIVFAE